MAMREARSNPRSPLGAATASAAFPGWGQILAGQRRMGTAQVVAMGLFLAAACVVIADEGAVGVIGWVVDPEVLLALLGLNLLLATVRVWSTTHAWLIAGGRLASLTLMALVLLVSIPHVALSYYGFQTRSTLMTVFSSKPDPPPALATEATPTSTSTTSTSLLTTTSHPPQTAVTTTTTSTIPPTTISLPLDAARFTVLLLGGDAGPGRPGLRTDTMIVASIDTVTGDAALFGLPRNMGGFTFSDGTPFPGSNQGLLNEVYQWGRRNPGRFDGVDPGASAVADVAATLLGIPIDHYILVDMVGFSELIDALGGIAVDVSRDTIAPVYDRERGTHTMITIPSGRQELDGDLALAFARSRTGSNDYDRMGRQRCLLTALASQVEPVNLFARLPILLHTIERRVTTDIPLGKIPDIVNLAPLISSDRVVVVGFDRGYRDGTTETGLARPDIDAIQAAVQLALSGQGGNDSALATASAACSP